LSAYRQVQRANDMAHTFSQETNFWYLCGINEPDWQLVIDGTRHRSWLVMPEMADVHRTFDGMLDPASAKLISGVDEVITRDEGDRLLRSLSRDHTVAYTIGQPPYSEQFNFDLNPAVHHNWQNIERVFKTVRDCRKELARLRAIKQPAEITMMKKAVALTAEAFTRVKAHMQQYRYEYEAEADFTQWFRSHGAVHAYDPIVASGLNACTLHYVRNDAKLPRSGLVLMDIGAQVGGYAADITRTYGLKTTTKRQRDVHNATVDAQRQIINLLKPGLPVEEYQREVDAIIGETLKQLGLYTRVEDIRKYMPHAISHGLGIDVHDSLGAPKHFEAGMVLTVEPGIYIPEESIGVRIEDDILITNTGHQNLSAGVSTDL
jgi:Xaa-Pro aminopeptidase